MIKALLLTLLITGCSSFEYVKSYRDNADSLKLGDTLIMLNSVMNQPPEYIECDKYILSSECTYFYTVVSGNYAFTIGRGFIIGIAKF